METNSRRLLALILLTSVILGVLYAIYTPLWQVPDEPAHFNYIRTLTEEGALPVMEIGDYDQAYIRQLVDNRFPADLSIESVTYEDHQPPLYYLLAATVYLLFDGVPMAIRIFSVALGLALLIVAYGLVRTLFPNRPSLALVTTAFVAFLPQHLAMTAGIENDGLAELLVGATLWMLIRYVKINDKGRQYLIGLGFTLGLIVLTKTTAYLAIPVTLATLWLKAQREETTVKTTAVRAGWVLLAMALVAGPWLVRNAITYGWTDPLGLVRHSAVVVGQPRTVEWLANYGRAGLAGRFIRTTFQSFWGQFGWMAVPFHVPIYLSLLILSGLLVAGFLGWLLERPWSRLTPFQVDSMMLLAATTLLAVIVYLGYNVTFVQHQGRYLFPALIPLALSAALGLEWLLAPRVARWAAAAMAGLGGLLIIWGLVRGDLPLIPAGTAFGLAALFGLAAFLPRWGRQLAIVALVAALILLDLYALFGAIIPTLAR